ncbi:hypothetical protein niasHT_030637 [Heterodera trifolii]|uniref:EF-hand domain-containing protein n=1 Tax=Heterodera trifolii TaxID=157864 RepID=A0ABD2HPX4_9BILA
MRFACALLCLVLAFSTSPFVSAFSPYANRILRQSPPADGERGVVPPSPPPSPPTASSAPPNRFSPSNGANFSSHRAAFASKLTPPSVDVNGQFPRRPPPPPQFVANNGPLIRAPDGQFVLASILPQQHQHFAAFSKGQIQQQIDAQFSASNNESDQNASSSPPPIDGVPPSEVPPSPPDESASTTDTLPTSPLAAPVDKSVDLDGDGALSLGEVQYAAFVHHGLSSSVVENLFNEIDQNKDNYLNSLEFNEIRPLVLAKAENAALRYLQNVDTDHNGQLSLTEAQNYILKEYGISNRDVERIWRLVVPSSGDEMDAVLFSKLRRRIRGMSIRLARQILKGADRDEDGQVNLREAQLIAFEQEGIGPGEVVEMLASVDDNNDGQLNAPEFADFERIVRARAVETSKKALKVVDTDGNNALTMDEAKKIAFEHYGFDEPTLEPFFAQADENEDSQLDTVEFAGFRSVIRGRAVKNAGGLLPEMDEDGDGMISESEAVQKTRQEDDMSAAETHGLFVVADQDKNGLLDKVELADFIRLVRLTAIKYVADHFRDYDLNRDKLITLDEVQTLVKERYKLGSAVTRKHFDKADLDKNGDLNAGEVVDFRHEIRRFTQDKAAQKELEEQNKGESAVERKETEEEEEEEEREEKSKGRQRKGERAEIKRTGQPRTGEEGQPKADGVEAVQPRTTGEEQPKADGVEAGQPRRTGEGQEKMDGGRQSRRDEEGQIRTDTTEKGQTRTGERSPTPTSDRIALSSPNATTQSLTIVPTSVTTLAPTTTLSSLAPQSLQLPSSSSPTNVSSPSPITSTDPSPAFSASSAASSPTSSPSSAPPPTHSQNLAAFPASSSPQLGPSNSQIASSPPPPSSSASPPLPSKVPFSEQRESAKEKADKREEKSETETEAKAELAEQAKEQRTTQKESEAATERTTEETKAQRERGETPEGTKRHKKRRRKTTTTTTSTTTTTTEAPTAEEEGDEYEEEGTLMHILGIIKRECAVAVHFSRPRHFNALAISDYLSRANPPSRLPPPRPFARPIAPPPSPNSILDCAFLHLIDMKNAVTKSATSSPGGAKGGGGHRSRKARSRSVEF